MNDDSAEWMTRFKSSGQLWPGPPEGIGGDGDAASLGLVKRVFEKGQQVLGTCSPEIHHDHVSLAKVIEILQEQQQRCITSPEEEAVSRCVHAVMLLPTYARCES